MVDLGSAPGVFVGHSSAIAINNSGVALGSMTAPDGTHAFTYDAFDGVQDLGLVGDGTSATENTIYGPLVYRGSAGDDINDAGQVTGTATNAGAIGAFRYMPGVGAEILPTLDNGPTHGWAIDSDGTVFGSSWVPDIVGTTYIAHFGHAMKFHDSIVGMVDLSDTVGAALGWTLYGANSVAGDYVVGTGNRGGTDRGFRMRKSESMIDELSAGWQTTGAAAVNSQGDAVGSGLLSATNNPTDADYNAFVYSDRFGFKNLNDMIDPASGWELLWAQGINDLGEIVGQGYHNGQRRAFRVRLPPGEAVTCQAQPVCSGPNPDPLCLYLDGVVDTGGGHFVAVFGYDNGGTGTIQPTTDTLLLDGVTVSNPQPSPPTSLPPGIHPGAYLPKFDAGHTVAWNVNGHVVTASASSPQLPLVPIGANGHGVDIGGTIISIDSEPGTPGALAPIAEGIATVGGTTYAVFGYANTDSKNLHVPYASDNILSTATGTLSNPSPAPPSWFLPGTHHGALVYPLTGELTWTLGTQSATLNLSSQQLTVTTQPQGTGVTINGTFVVVVPNPAAGLQGSIVATEDTSWGGPFPASFNVGSDGAALVNVPLWVAPGRAGMQPGLALSYDSHNTTRWDGLGPGWHVEGLSQITRCSKTLARDGVITEANVNDDTFCLDGDMLVFQGASDPDNQGYLDTVTYRTENDRFAKILRHIPPGVPGDPATPPDTFTVYLKDGRILSYNAVVTAPLTTDTIGAAGAMPVTNVGTQAFAYAWSLSSAADRAGNTIAYTYNTTLNNDRDQYLSSGDELCVEQHIDTISYGSQQIKFQYVPVAGNDMPLRRRTFTNGGFCMETTRKMTGIQVLGLRPETGTAGPQLLKQYDLNVSSAGLSSVTERDAAGISSSRSVGFDYEDSSPTALSAPTFTPLPITLPAVPPPPPSVPSYPGPTFTTGDVNGDGFDDLVYFLSGTGIVVQLSNGDAPGMPTFGAPVPVVGTFTGMPSLLQVLDADMDGKADIFVTSTYVSPVEVTQITYLRSVGYDATSGTFTTDAHMLTQYPLNGSPPLIADLNGDGLADMLAIAGSGTNPMFQYWSMGTVPFSGEVASFTALGSDAQAFGYSVPVIAGRFANRQTTSFLHVTDATLNYLELMTADGQQLVKASNVFTPILPAGPKYFTADLNGDGLSDLVAVNSSWGQTDLSNLTGTTPTALINTGAGFRAHSLMNVPARVPPQALVAADTPLGVADLNRDGFDDLLILAKDPRQAVPPSGLVGATIVPVPGYAYMSDGNSLTAIAIPSLVNNGDAPFRILDFNGDGRPDVLTMNSVGGPHVKVYRNEQPRPLLVGMHGGLNDTPTSIQYDAVGRVAQGAPGGANCTSTYPLYCPAVGPLVVTNAYFKNRDAGDSDGTLETFSYSGPEMDLRGRGWLGVKHRREVTSPILAPTDIASIHDTEYSYGGNTYALTDSASPQYYYPFARRATGDITYYVNHGGALEGTALAIASGTQYSTSGSTVHTVLPNILASQKRTVANVNSVLATMALSFDPNPWPVSGAVTSSRSTMQLDSFGDPTFESSVTNLADGTTIAQTVNSTYLDNQDNWIVGRLQTRTVTEVTPGGSATRSWNFGPNPTTGLLENETYQAGIANEQLQTVYTRNANGLPTLISRTIATGENRTTQIIYDDFDGTFPKQVINALDQPTQLTYHPGFGVLVATQDANGQRFASTYDGLGRLRSQVGPDGTGAQMHYENPELSPSDPRLGSTEVYQIHTVADTGAETKTVYDILNRETLRSTKDFTGTAFDAASTAYDPQNLSRAVRVTIPSATAPTNATPASAFVYDSMGRPTSITSPEGTTFAYTYGVDGTTWSVGGPDGHSESRVEDGRGLLIAKSEFVQKPGDVAGHNVSQSYRYGPFGVAVGIDVTDGPSTTITPDASGRRTALDDPDTGHSTYTWNGFGDLIQSTDAKNEVKTYVPDALGRVSQVVTVDGTTTYEWDSAPNGIGKLAKTTSPDSVDCSYGYDPAGRSSSTTWTLRTGIAGADGAYTIATGYDPAGRVSSLSYPGVAGQPPVVLSHSYAPNGSLSAVLRASSSLALWTANTRNARGQVTAETAGNGVVTTYDYPDPMGLLHEVTSTLGTQVVRDLVYDYDDARRLKQRTTDGQLVEIFQYDTIDRLVDWQTGATDGSPHAAYTYDDLGNLTLAQRIDTTAISSTSFVPGDGSAYSQHQIASSSLGNYVYDARGDQITAPGRTVNYTTFGLPKTVTTRAGTTSFAYDASQSRVLKISGGDVIVSLGGLFERRVHVGQPTDVFYVPGDGRPVAQIVWSEAGNSVSESVQYLHTDDVQSIEAITDATGQNWTRQRFEPFGARISSPAASVRIGYQGAEHDDDIGLINMNGRLYDPIQFRFITADPVVPDPHFGQDLNRYAFVRNSPLNFIDPSGFDGEPPPNGGPCEGCPPDSADAPHVGPLGSPPIMGPAPDPDGQPNGGVRQDSQGPAAPSGSSDENGNHSTPEGGWDSGPAGLGLSPIDPRTGQLLQPLFGMTTGAQSSSLPSGTILASEWNGARGGAANANEEAYNYSPGNEPPRNGDVWTGTLILAAPFGAAIVARATASLFAGLVLRAPLVAGAAGSGAAAGGAAVAGRVAASPVGVAATQVFPRVMSDLFGKYSGPEGSVAQTETVLAEIKFFGGQLIPPPGLTTQMILQYRDIALQTIARGADTLGVQQMRLHILDAALNTLSR
jgi:RHS repeat-associated protein